MKMFFWPRSPQSQRQRPWILTSRRLLSRSIGFCYRWDGRGRRRIQGHMITIMEEAIVYLAMITEARSNEINQGIDVNANKVYSWGIRKISYFQNTYSVILEKNKMQEVVNCKNNFKTSKSKMKPQWILSLSFLPSLFICDQPVHNSGSSGYCSLNRSDHHLGMTSSTESLDNGSGSKMQQAENEVSSKARPVSKPKYLQFETMLACPACTGWYMEMADACNNNTLISHLDWKEG